MHVNANPNANWTELVTESLKGTSLEGVDVAQATQGEDGNLTITLTGADGASQVVTIEPPALDADNGTSLSEEGLSDLQAKLETAFDDLKAAIEEGEKMAKAGVKPSSQSQQVLFDIYSLMRLMLEIAREEREAARHTRYAELTRAVADVKCRADEIRSAAKTSLIMSVAFSAASILAQGVAMGMSARAQNKSIQMETASGVKEAQQNLTLLSAKDGHESAANLAKVEKSLTPAQRQLAESYFGDAQQAKTALGRAQTAEVDAQKGLARAQEKFTAASGKAGQDVTPDNVDARIAETRAPLERSLKIDELEAEVSRCEGALSSLEAEDPLFATDDAKAAKAKLDKELATAKGNLAQAREQIDGNAELRKLVEFKTAADELAAAKETLGGAQKDLAAVRDGYATALNNDQNSLEASLGARRLQLAECERNGGTLEVGGQKVTAKQLKAEIADLEAARHWGKAHVVNEKMQNGLAESLAGDYKAAHAVFELKSNLLNQNAEYRKATAAVRGWQMGGDIFRQSGDLLNGLTNHLNSMRQAAATEYEAAQKTDEAAREESNDLAASAQQLLQTVLDLLRAVQSAENQSIQRIMA